MLEDTSADGSDATTLAPGRRHAQGASGPGGRAVSADARARCSRNRRSGTSEYRRLGRFDGTHGRTVSGKRPGSAVETSSRLRQALRVAPDMTDVVVREVLALREVVAPTGFSDHAV